MKRLVMITMLTALLVGGMLPALAQDGGTPITPANAADLAEQLTVEYETVNALAWSPDSTQLAVAGTPDIWLYDAGDWAAAPLALQGHTSTVWDVAFSPDGSLLASAGWDGMVRVWDAASGAQIAALSEPDEPVWSVAFSPDGSQLAAGSLDQRAWLWALDGDSPTLTGSFEGHTGGVYDVAFSADGASLITASSDHTLRLWDAASGSTQATLTGHDNIVWSMALGPAGAQIASGGWDNDVRLWDAAPGDAIALLEGHTDWVHTLDFNADGSRLLTVSDDFTARIWNIAAAEVVHVLENGPGSDVLSAAYSPDGALVAVGRAAYDVAETDDGETARIEASEAGVVELWTPEDGVLATLESHAGGVTLVAFSPDGTWLATVDAGLAAIEADEGREAEPGALRLWAVPME
jgi:WD40 repeat protein